MNTGFKRSVGTPLGKRIAIAATALATLVFAVGVAAEDRPVPPDPDLGVEIRAQGAAALQEMTRQLKRDSDWGRRGAAALAVVLEQPAVTDRQVAGNIKPNCRRCHENRERG